MKLDRRQLLHLATSAAVLPAMPRAAYAEGSPARPLRLLVGFAAGGNFDTVARLMG